MLGIRPGSFRALTQPYVKAAALRGLSSTQITGILQAEYGHAYRRTDLLGDLRFYRDLPRRAGIIESTRLDRRIGEDVHALGHVKIAEANYRYVAEVTLRSRLGEEVTDYVSVSYRDRQTRGKLEDDASELAAEYPTRRDYELVGARIIEPYRRA